MALANLSLSSTFTQHIVRTNQTIKVINDIENLTHPLANIVLEAAATASNVAGLAVGAVVGNNTILGAMSNGVNSIIISMYDDIYNDSNVAVSKSNIAYNQSNVAMELANGYVQNSTSIVANVILSNVNTYNIMTNVAGQIVNNFIANTSIASIYNRANTAGLVANLAYNKANTANLTADIGLLNANTALEIAIAAFTASNAAGSSDTVIAAYSKGNAAHLTANTATTIANAAFVKANAASSNTIVVAAFEQANLSYEQANSAFEQVGGVLSYAQQVANTASFAYDKANTASMNIFNDIASSETNFYPTMVRNTSGLTNQINVSSTKLYFKPSTGELTSYSFNSLSDESVKENIVRIENALDLIEQLNGVNFQWKETHQKSSGVIAQNLINVVPHLVYSPEDKPLTVNYDGLSALFIEAIKELNREVKSIKNHLGI